jgi:hypothetical protein
MLNKIKKMLPRIFLPAIVAIILSCKKENDTLNEKIPATELLTQKPWVLASHGFDNNRNNIDPSEDGIDDCQKDNITHFYTDGTGLVDDNILSCAKGIDRQPFTWFFINSETGIDFLLDTVKLFRLNEQELILYKELIHSNGDTIKFMSIYRH